MVVRDYSKGQVWSIDHGFKRLGKMSTPFTLLGGDKRPEAEEIHSDRPKSEQQADEDSNEPVTTELGEWEGDLEGLDYPGVDTIPYEKLLKRAQEVLAAAEALDFVNTVEMPADIYDPQCKGEFKKVPKKIRVDTDPDDFLGYRQGPVLAHETGHAFDVGVGNHGELAGYDEREREVFDTQEALQQARKISERLRGTIPSGVGDYTSYREGREELFADVFASMVIEPEAAVRVAPDAVRCVRENLETHLNDPPF
jgi:hypothetical protein